MPEVIVQMDRAATLERLTRGGLSPEAARKAADALEAGALKRFRRLFVAGLHARALKHRLRHHPEAGRIEILRPSPPEGVMNQILTGEGDGGGLLFGFGNIAGLGRAMVSHWRKVGEPYGI